MNRATGNAVTVTRKDTASNSWTDDIKAHNATYFTAEMLHRTSEPAPVQATVWSVDHFALDRMARSLRRDHLAQMVYAAQLAIGKAATGAVGVVRAALAPSAAAVVTSFAAGLDATANRVAGWQRQRREQYLNQATDVYDLERRMRDMERRHHRSFG